MKVLWSKTFAKQFQKQLEHAPREVVFDLVKKFPHTSQLILLAHTQSYQILKGYILGKKFRIIILFQQHRDVFIPIVLVKKESKQGLNIRKQNYESLFGSMIDKIQADIVQDSFEIIDLD